MTKQEFRELAITRLREHGPIAPNLFVSALSAETGYDLEALGERIWELIDDHLIGITDECDLVLR